MNAPMNQPTAPARSERRLLVLGNSPRCRDFDEDCEDVRDKYWCAAYDPQQGFCPYVHSTN